jgi:catechol 2,3-dioxygenase-like lactoylglutathione lyase family enzyme
MAGLTLSHLTFDCRDARAVARFWQEALDYDLTDHSEGGDIEIELKPKDGSGANLLFLQVPESKTVKNRLHFDLRPKDQAAEVERVKALGATEVDIGQGDQTWVVLADIEGNEFCILRSLQED